VWGLPWWAVVRGKYFFLKKRKQNRMCVSFILKHVFCFYPPSTQNNFFGGFTIIWVEGGGSGGGGGHGGSRGGDMGSMVGQRNVLGGNKTCFYFQTNVFFDILDSLIKTQQVFFVCHRFCSNLSVAYRKWTFECSLPKQFLHVELRNISQISRKLRFFPEKCSTIFGRNSSVFL